MSEIEQNLIIGTARSIIQHRIRCSLGLNVGEYCIMEYIYNLNEMYSSKPIHITDMANRLGVKLSSITKAIEGLIERGFLANTSRLETQEKWNINFKNETLNSGFESLWRVEPIGNKQLAKRAYIKCMKIVSHETLIDAYKAYIVFSVHNGTILKHTSTWLNPENRHWEDNYTIVTEKQNSAVVAGKF